MEKPILFNGDMVRAILEDRKVQTRRIIGDMCLQEMTKTGEVNKGLNRPPYKLPKDFRMWRKKGFIYPEWGYDIQTEVDARKIVPLISPYPIETVLWVRETWQHFCLNRNTMPNRFAGHSDYCYKATVGNDCCGEGGCKKWRPSIHMPREAARLFPTVKSVRVERVQDITEEDAIKEGVPTDHPMESVYCPQCKGEGLIGTLHPVSLGYMEIDCHHCDTAVKRFSYLWDSIYAKPQAVCVRDEDGNRYITHYESFPFDGESRTETYKGKPHYIYANPWVWAVEFERLTSEGVLLP
ncbi:MAG: hypothetical protein ACYDG4_10765 [Desulfuromonadaceae bacterium]